MPEADPVYLATAELLGKVARCMLQCCVLQNLRRRATAGPREPSPLAPPFSSATSHVHIFNGVTYYMPSGGTEGVDFFHGSYRPGGAAASLKNAT